MQRFSENSYILSLDVSAMQLETIENSYFFLALRFFIASFAVVGNVIILLTIFRSPRMRSRVYNILIAQLALSDLIVGLGLLVRVVATTVLKIYPPPYYTEVYCASVAAITVFGMQLSQLTVLLIAADRLTAIKWPMDYKNKNPLWTPLRAFSCCVIVSSIGIFLLYLKVDPSSRIPICTLSARDIHGFAPYWIAFSLVLCAFIFCAYGYTMHLVNTSNDLLKKMETSREFARQKRVFLTISVVLLSYFVCYVCPFGALLVALIFQAPELVLSLLVLVAGVLSAVNAAINILLYGWKYEELRVAMLRFVKGKAGITRDSSIRSIRNEGCLGSLRSSFRRKKSASSERPIALSPLEGDVLL